MSQSQQLALVDDASPSIYMHAELLANIRQLTLYVSLPNSPPSSEHESTISLSESRRAVTVYFTHGEGNEKVEVAETLKLPARVSEASRRTLNFAGHRVGVKDDVDTAAGTRREFSFRLPEDQDEGVDMAPNNGLQDDDFVPWTAEDMSACTALHCRFCSRVVLGGTRTKIQTTSEDAASGWTWKDLPSGNWAEMMDFWHCHKPDPHEHEPEHEREQQETAEDRTASIKGYGAASQVVATPGTILVDVASFLVAEVDCQGLKKSEVAAPTSSGLSSTRVNVECEGCGAILGMEDRVADGWRLYKANLSAKWPSHKQLPGEEKRDGESSLLEYYPTETIVSAQLLEMIQREGVRRFVIHAGERDGMLLWVFNPDLRYSSCSVDHSIMARRALKVFYQDVTDVERLLEPEKGRPAPISLEELFLPMNIFTEVVDALRRSNGILPMSARVFREWNVGFLSRFERGQSR
ncbi:hypothetical protein VTN77DRAFT_1044 [Rasamsonia byssochlamydoides]|uniref:uncharacterized protein n=1 Tax=Rasamsonia byssochlamydoides TaxID=89139 RepID=UPI0037434EA4